jgi:uncharacterized membrane protein YgaE (UPF0421/DUF939 family)
MNKGEKYIGMRNIKTAIAVGLSIVVARLFALQSPFYTSIAAIISMQDTVENGYKAGKDRLLGTIVGAIVGICVAYIAKGRVIIISLGIVLLIAILNLLKWKKSVSIAGVVFCAINLNLHGDNPFIYATYRTTDTIIGIVIAILVNRFIYPPLTDINFEFRNLIKYMKVLIENSNEGEEIDIGEALKNTFKVRDNLENAFKNKKININSYKYAQKIIVLSINIVSYLKVIEDFKKKDILPKEQKPEFSYLKETIDDYLNKLLEYEFEFNNKEIL